MKYVVGLVFLIAFFWSIHVWLGCSDRMTEMKAKLAGKIVKFEELSSKRRDELQSEMDEKNARQKSEMEMRKNEITRELNSKQMAAQERLSSLKKAIESRESDSDAFRRVRNKTLAAEYRDYQGIGNDLSYARRLLKSVESFVENEGRKPSEDFIAMSSRVKDAQSKLDEIGRKFQKTITLLLVQERQTTWK